jgi:hypothetical protein
MLTPPIVSLSSSSTFSILPDTSFNTSEGGSGDWYSGEYAQDKLDINGSVFEDFTFALINQGVEVGDDFIGLGDKVDEAAVQDEFSETENTLLTYAVSKGLIQTTAFSIWFDDPSEKVPTGEILLGGVDAGKIIGGLETLDTTIVRGTETWYDTVLAVSLEGLSFSPNGDLSHQNQLEPFQPLLVHPTTSSMWLPPDVATAVWAGLGASYDKDAKPEDAIPVVPCSYLSNTTTLNLEFGPNTIIPVPMSDLTVHNGTGVNGEDGEYAEGCKLDIVAVANTSFNTVGTAALKHMYTVFDLQNNEISIGLRGGSSEATNILEIGPSGVPALSLNGSSPTTTPTPKPTPSPTPVPKKSHALAIGLGVGIPLGVLLLGSIIAGLFFVRRKRAAPAAAPAPKSDSMVHSSWQPQYNHYPQTGIPDKVLLDAPTRDVYSVSPPTGYLNQPTAQFQNTSPTSPEIHHELPDVPMRYSELSGISNFHPPHSPSQSPTHSPLPGP